MLQRSHPARYAHLMDLAQRDIDDRWHYYEQIANVERSLADLMDQCRNDNRFIDSLSWIETTQSHRCRPLPFDRFDVHLEGTGRGRAAAVVLQSMFAEQIEHEEHQLALLSHYAGRGGG